MPGAIFLAALAFNGTTVDYCIIFNYYVIKRSPSARLRRTRIDGSHRCQTKLDGITKVIPSNLRPARFERATLCLEGRCSIRLSYGRTSYLNIITKIFLCNTKNQLTYIYHYIYHFRLSLI